VGDDKFDSFDDLFEPFELEEGPPPEEEHAPPAPRPQDEPAVEEEPGPVVACPSCGTTNPAYNRHCEACGARLGKGPLPVAPPPMVRATPGGRALGVLAAVVLLVALGALILNVVGGDDPVTATTVTAPPSTSVPPVQELQPTTVRASSELNATFAAQNLLDSDVTTEWQDQGLRGEGATLTFEFSQPVSITDIEFVNVADVDRFRQNFRIRGFKITVDDLAVEQSYQLEDVNTAQRFPVQSVRTNVVTIEVTSTYAAEPAGERPPFSELALADIRFFGRVAS
jgi:hypothetical protein